MKIGHKLFLAFAGLTLLVGTVGFIGLSMSQRMLKAHEGGEEHFRSIVEAAVTAIHAVKEIETQLLLNLSVGREPLDGEAKRWQKTLQDNVTFICQNAQLPEARALLEIIETSTDEFVKLGSAIDELFRQDRQTRGTFDFDRHKESIRRLNTLAMEVRENALRLARFETDFLNRQTTITSATEVSSYARRAEAHLMLYLALHDPIDRGKFFQRYHSLRHEVALLEERVKREETETMLQTVKEDSATLLSAGLSLLSHYDSEVARTGTFDPAAHSDLLFTIERAAHRIGEQGMNISAYYVGREAEARERAWQSVRSFQRTVLTVFAVALFIALASGYGITQTLSIPLERLRDSATAVGRGLLDTQIEVRSKDEIGQVAGAFNTMVRELEASRAELLAAKHELERRVENRTIELKKLNEQLMIDIDRRVRAEEALRQSEEHFRALTENASDLITVLDADATIRYCSPSVMRVLGYSPDFFIGKNALEFVHPEDIAHVGAVLEQTVRQPGTTNTVEYRFKHQDGMYLTLESVGRAIAGIEAVSVTVNSRDISERKRAEEALRQSEEKYRIVADNTYDWEFWLSPAGKFLYLSPSCKRVTGYDVAQFEEDPEFLCRVIHPDDRDYFRTHRDNVEKKMTADEIAFRIVDPEGATKWIGHVCQPVFDDDGAFIGTRGSNRDITDRKRVADALRESEEKYRALMDGAGDAIMLSDTEGVIVEANRKAEELTGYTREELLGMHVGQVMHDDHRKHGLAAFEEVVTGGFARVPEAAIRTKNGAKILVDVVGRLISYRGTRLVQAIIRDVTYQRQAEEALRASEARYRAIVEDQTELICRFLPDGTLTFVNDAYCRYFGKEREELLGSRFTPLIPQEDWPLIEAYMRTLGPANPVASVEHRVIDASGQVRWQRWTDRAIFDREGSIVECQSVGRDITDQKRAGDALRASEQRFRMLVENLPQKIFLKDERSVYLYCNGNFARDLKISQEEILGKTDFDLYPPKSANKHIAEDREVIEHRTPLSMEARYEKDGRHVMIHLIKTPILDDEGNVKGILGIIWDITERARLESIAEAVNTTENIGYVFSGIRHEIGNPINSLKITLSVLRSKAHEYSKEMCLTYIERAMSEIARVEYLLKALKNYNLYEVPDIRDINMREFLDKFASLVAADCAQRGVSLQVNLGHDAESGRADPRALQQVLLNILVNSLDALKGRDNPMVKIQTSRENGAVKISVTDNGIGMTEEQQKDLFKPFRTTKATGTGLGLVIAMKMLTRMKGTISVQSRKGEGTTTDITIPEGRDE